MSSFELLDTSRFDPEIDEECELLLWFCHFVDNRLGYVMESVVLWNEIVIFCLST